jgi:hypothetical protein
MISYNIFYPFGLLSASLPTLFTIYATGGTVPDGLQITPAGIGLTITPSPVPVGSSGVATFTAIASPGTYTITFTNSGSLPDVDPITVVFGAQGQFATQGDIEDQFGITNVAVWSNLDNNQTNAQTPTANVSRIQAALQWADAKIINLFFTQGNYTTPIVPLGTDVILLKRWDAILAGTWLYLSRGLRDDDAQGNHLKKLQDETIAEIMSHRGKEKLNAARRWPTSTAPVGYNPKC